jgi:hypothetical protein
VDLGELEPLGSSEFVDETDQAELHQEPQGPVDRDEGPLLARTAGIARASGMGELIVRTTGISLGS